MKATYKFFTEHLPNGDVRLTWSRNGKPVEPLDFVITAPEQVEATKAPVRAGLCD